MLVALGSMVDVAQSQQALEQMHGAFAQLPQGVIWKCSPSRWPRDLPLAANVKLVDWLPQSDLLGKGTCVAAAWGSARPVQESLAHAGLASFMGTRPLATFRGAPGNGQGVGIGPTTQEAPIGALGRACAPRREVTPEPWTPVACS